MTLYKDVDQPVRDRLADLLVPARAGICFVCDPRGTPDATGKRYGYLIEALSETDFHLLRLDLGSRAKQFCANRPDAAGVGTYNTAIMAALYDANGGPLWDQPTIYVLVSLTAAPWAQWMSYTIATDTWLVLAAPPCGPAGATPLATSVSLCHPCETLGQNGAAIAGVGEDYIYANGDAGQWGAAGPSGLAQYAKAGNVWVRLAGAGAARGVAPGAGSKSVWVPTFPHAIFCTDGGASAQWEIYYVAADAWGLPFTPLPARILGEGTELCTLFEAPGWVAIRPADHVTEIFCAYLGNFLGAVPAGVYSLLCELDGAMLPAAHASNALIAWWVAGNFYIGAIPYGRSVVYRIQLPMPT